MKDSFLYLCVGLEVEKVKLPILYYICMKIDPLYTFLFLFFFCFLPY